MPNHDYNAALVERVRSFVNTYELDGDNDRIATPDDLLTWLTEMDLLDDSVEMPRSAAAANLALAHQLRSTLHELLRHSSGDAGHAGGLDVEARRRIDELSDQLPLRVVLCSGGQPYLVPAVGGVRHGLARILAAVAALPPNDWERLKVCPADDCQWVFYDESRNRSRRWCAMEGCGNRSKVRSYRQRVR